MSLKSIKTRNSIQVQQLNERFSQSQMTNVIIVIGTIHCILLLSIAALTNLFTYLKLPLHSLYSGC